MYFDKQIHSFYIGFATFNPVAASPLIGFGSPPKNVQINFSILDMFGLQDKTIPYSEETSEGIYYLFLLSIFGLGRLINSFFYFLKIKALGQMEALFQVMVSIMKTK